MARHRHCHCHPLAPRASITSDLPSLRAEMSPITNIQTGFKGSLGVGWTQHETAKHGGLTQLHYSMDSNKATLISRATTVAAEQAGPDPGLCVDKH